MDLKKLTPISNDASNFIKGPIMSVSGISSSNYVAPVALTQGSSQISGASDPDGDGGGHRSHKARGAGGQMQNVLLQALQSLGLSMPQQSSATTVTTAASSTGQTSSGTDSDGDNDGSTSATSSVKKDMRQFMHALFPAVKSENASSTSGGSGTGTSSTDPKSNFAAGLSALISQVSNGTAPADLQSAFAKVAADLQPVSMTSASTNTTSAGTSSSTPQATLQALLTQLQQNLGYGATSSTAAIGNFVSALA
jgi:hypothetical protein